MSQLDQVKRLMKEKTQGLTFEEIAMFHISDIVKIFSKIKRTIDYREYTIKKLDLKPQKSEFDEIGYIQLPLDQKVTINRIEYDNVVWFIDGKEVLTLYWQWIPICIVSYSTKGNKLIIEQIQGSKWWKHEFDEEGNKKYKEDSDNPFLEPFDWPSVLIVVMELYCFVEREIDEINIVEAQKLFWYRLGDNQEKQRRLERIYDNTAKNLGYAHNKKEGVWEKQLTDFY